MRPSYQDMVDEWGIGMNGDKLSLIHPNGDKKCNFEKRASYNRLIRMNQRKVIPIHLHSPITPCLESVCLEAGLELGNEQGDKVRAWQINRINRLITLMGLITD